jgi:hypothetical protein
MGNKLNSRESKLVAKIGEHCIICDYRPWCNAYWFSERKNKDAEGEICRDHPRDSKSFCLKNNKNHQIVLNMSAFPFPIWSVGTRVRLLDPVMHGEVYAKGVYSELYRVESFIAQT